MGTDIGKRPRMRALPWLVLLGVVGCGPQEALLPEEDGTELSAAEEQLLSTPLRARAGDLIVWLNPLLTSRLVDNQVRWVATGRTSRDVEGAFSFVPDDAYAQATVTGPRSFELSFDDRSELNTLMSGTRLLVRFTVVGQAAPVFAGVRFAPRFTNITGSTRMSISPEVVPVYANGGLTYRGRARATSPSATLSASTLDDATIALRRRAVAGQWNVDLSFDDLALALSVPGVNSDKVEFTLAEGSALRSKLAVLAGTVSGLELTTADPYQVWFPTRCTTPVRACLNALPVGTTDFGDCGTYREVDACGLPNQVPALFSSPDDLTALDAALAQVRATLPAGKSVAYTAFGVNGRNATVELVGRAWLDQVSLANATVVGTLTPGQVNTLLDGWQARALVPAAQRVVYQSAFKALRIDAGGRSHVLLYFATAARLVVLTVQG